MEDGSRQFDSALAPVWRWTCVRQDTVFRKSVATRRLNLRAIDRVTGLAYSAGRAL
jgi:hypothetical protein